MGYRVCANLEEAETAQACRVLWLRYPGDLGKDVWVPAYKGGCAPVRGFYGMAGWPKEDFAVLVEDEDSE